MERAPPFWGAPAKLTAVGAVAAVMVTLPAGLAGVVSSVVATVKPVFVYVAAGGLTIPATVNAPDWPAVNAQDAPERVTVSVVPVAAPVAAQLA